MTVARVLGQPVGYSAEHGGSVVQNISPTAADAMRQTSTSSRSQLQFHTETAFHRQRPRTLLLLCLRGDPTAATTLCCIDDVVDALAPEVRQALHEPRFRTRVDESFGGTPTGPLSNPAPVLSGEWEHPAMVFDAALMVGTDPAATAALEVLGETVAALHTSVVLEPGDLLVIDNSRCVHGRTAFVPRFDGTDRWLQRTFVLGAGQEAAGDRQGRRLTTRFAS